jgi:hypothetical protein
VQGRATEPRNETCRTWTLKKVAMGLRFETWLNISWSLGSVRCGCAPPPPPPPPHPDSSVTHHRDHAPSSPVAFFKVYRALAIVDAIESDRGHLARAFSGQKRPNRRGAAAAAVRQRRERGAKAALRFEFCRPGTLASTLQNEAKCSGYFL